MGVLSEKEQRELDEFEETVEKAEASFDFPVNTYKRVRSVLHEKITKTVKKEPEKCLLVALGLVFLLGVSLLEYTEEPLNCDPCYSYISTLTCDTEPKHPLCMKEFNFNFTVPLLETEMKAGYFILDMGILPVSVAASYCHKAAFLVNSVALAYMFMTCVWNLLVPFLGMFVHIITLLLVSIIELAYLFMKIVMVPIISIVLASPIVNALLSIRYVFATIFTSIPLGLICYGYYRYLRREA